MFEVGINRAVSVLAEKRAGGGRGGRAAPGALKELGPHPADGEPIKVMSGRFGPYVKHGSTNANVPRGADPQAITLDEAVKLLAEREAKGGSARKSRPPQGARPRKPARKKPAAKKPARNGPERVRASLRRWTRAGAACHQTFARRGD